MGQISERKGQHLWINSSAPELSGSDWSIDHSPHDQCPDSLSPEASKATNLQIPLESSSSRPVSQPIKVKSRSKWRPEMPEINWQDCFCFCFFIYLMCTETESEKRKKAEKRTEKEKARKRKELAKEQEKERKKKIKEMVRRQEQEEITNEKVSKGKKTIKGNKWRGQSEIIPGKVKRVNANYRSGKDPVMHKRRPNHQEPSDMKLITATKGQPQLFDQNKINNLDSINFSDNRHRPQTIIINWNDLN